MTEETITILEVKTFDAVKSVNDLKENISNLKHNLGQLEIGTTKYQDTLDELKVNQNALKDAMYATSTSMDDVKNSATGAGESYNALVHRMASLKEELRSTDVSTEQGAARFKELASQVNQVNDRLKEMDAMQGNFQRNVGNYESAFKGMAKYTDALDKGLKATSHGVGGLKNGFDALSASPAVATFAILVSSVMSLANALKKNESVAASLQKGLESLKPLMDFFKGILDTIAEYIGDLIVKVSEFVTSNGLFDKLIQGVMGVGNAVLKFVVAPFKGIVKAIDILKDEGIKGLKNATKAFGDELKTGVSFKQNFQAGQAAADAIVKGAKSKKDEVKETGKEIGKDLGDGIDEGLKLSDLEKTLANNERRLEEYRQRILQESKEIADEISAETDLINSEIEAYFEEEARMREQDLKDAEEKSKAKIQTLSSVATATGSILGSIAGMYEADEKNAEKNANKIKTLKIAEATINTINGAIGAFMQAAATMPPPFGQIVGAAQAAAITATGMAQIAQIRKTKVSSSSGSSSSISAISTAPSLDTNVSNVRTLTSSSEEDRLNQMASSQRVYILASDIQASQNQIKTQVAEASF